MTAQELARRLNGSPFPLALPPDLLAQAMTHHLAIAYLAAGEVVELHGALTGRIASGEPVKLSSVGFRLYGGADVTATFSANRLSRDFECAGPFEAFAFQTQARRGPYGAGVVFGLKGIQREAPALQGAVAARLVQMTDYTRVLSFFGHPGLGQFVVTGPIEGNAPNAMRIGFCVQVRRRWGRHGSDVVILRHADGMLQVHEHQGFFAMTEAQEAIARQYFSGLPEDEDYTQGYLCSDKVHRVGFLITEARPQAALFLQRA